MLRTGAVGRAGPAPAVAGAGSALAWGVRRDGPLPGALNMARDHALASSLPANQAVLRLYQWERPTLSLGRNEPALGVYDPGAARRLGVDVVRRPTGGRAVLHARELTYAVAAPARAVGGPRAAYRWIHERIARGLSSLGVPVGIAPDPPSAAPPDAGPCFQLAAGGEVVALGRKLVGSAQLRVGDVLLQHGSILLADDQGLLEELRAPDGAGAESPAGRPATLAELLGGPPDVQVIREALEEAFMEATGPLADDVPLPGDSGVEAELEARYRSDAWTWRR